MRGLNDGQERPDGKGTSVKDNTGKINYNTSSLDRNQPELDRQKAGNNENR